MGETENTITSEMSEKHTAQPLISKWDKCLTDYDNYLKEYIKHYKKSLRGNLDSLSKYPYMKEKSEALCEQLNGAQNKELLTEKQVKRISKIQMRMVNACGTLK
jgi:hypothetical protein